jgi:hypothetical protein
MSRKPAKPDQDKVLKDIIALDTAAQIQIKYKIEDILKEKKEALEQESKTILDQVKDIEKAVSA